MICHMSCARRETVRMLQSKSRKNRENTKQESDRFMGRRQQGPNVFTVVSARAGTKRKATVGYLKYKYE